MREVRIGIKHGFRGVGEVLMGQPMRRLMESRANTVAMLYQASVAKRSGALARDVRVTTKIGGRNNDRWTGQVIVGERIDHDLRHEFGWTQAWIDEDGTRHTGDHHPGAKDLKQALGRLAGYV